MKTERVLDGIDFGEGPRWHGARLWFSDFHQLVVCAVAADGSVEEIVTVPGRPSGLGWLPDEVAGRGLGRLEAARVTRPHAGLP